MAPQKKEEERMPMLSRVAMLVFYDVCVCVCV